MAAKTHEYINPLTSRKAIPEILDCQTDVSDCQPESQDVAQVLDLRQFLPIYTRVLNKVKQFQNLIH